jgi:glucokinase
MWKGPNKQDTFLFLALGTGIGGAIIINGKLYKGIGGAGEAGHIIINENGEECTCGGRGCYERYASTLAFIRNYCRISGESENEINGEILMAKVERGEPLAVKAYSEFIGHIATGLVSLVTLLDPGFVIIGGGISAKGEGFINDINRIFLEKAMPSYSSHTKIIPASLQNDAGLIGACYAAYNY